MRETGMEIGDVQGKRYEIRRSLYTFPKNYIQITIYLYMTIYKQVVNLQMTKENYTGLILSL